MEKILYRSFREINEALKENPSNDPMTRCLFSDIRGDNNSLLSEISDKTRLEHPDAAIVYNIIEAMIKIEDMLTKLPQDRGVGRTRIGINFYFSADRKDIQNLKMELLKNKAKEIGDIEKEKDITCFITKEILDKFLGKLKFDSTEEVKKGGG